MSTYYEMLKDPRWQRKRLEILQAADFKCVDCGSAESTLHVHHMYYEKGKKPWEYDNLTLRCLCEDCHSRIQDTQAEIARMIAYLHTGDLTFVLGFVEAATAISAYAQGDTSASVVMHGANAGDLRDQGIAQCFGINREDLYTLSAETGGRISVATTIAARERERKERDG